MSSSSKNEREMAPGGLLADEHLWIVRLLRAMSLEWADLSGKIAELGAGLSTSAISGSSAQFIRDMQAFDSLSQRAFAQFRLLEGICQELSARRRSGAPDIDALIEALPFVDLREWFVAAVKGENPSSSQSVAGEEESVHWFG